MIPFEEMQQNDPQCTLELVVLLAAHMAGGVRLLMLEFLAWRDWQKCLLAVAADVSLAVGLAFALTPSFESFDS